MIVADGGDVALFVCDIGEMQEDVDDTVVGLIEPWPLEMVCEGDTAPVSCGAWQCSLCNLATALTLCMHLAQPHSRQPHIPSHPLVVPQWNNAILTFRLSYMVMDCQTWSNLSPI
jgi:hypothetical protein